MSTGSTRTVTNNNMTDGRKFNRGSSISKQNTNLRKNHVIETHERAAGDVIVAEWVRKNNVGREFEKYLGKSKTG